MNLTDTILPACQVVAKVPSDKESQYTETAIKEKLNIASLRRDPNLPESDDNAKLKRLILYLERCQNSGRLLAKVDVLHPESFIHNRGRYSSSDRAQRRPTDKTPASA